MLRCERKIEKEEEKLYVYVWYVCLYVMCAYKVYVVWEWKEWKRSKKGWKY